MQYNKNAEGKFEPLGRHNVDTGMGVERTVCMLSGAATVFDTEIFAPIMAKIDELSTTTGASGGPEPLPKDAELTLRARRIVADHMRTATFILCDPKGGVKPGNIGANYVLRRLIRRAVRYSRFLGIAPGFTVKRAEPTVFGARSSGTPSIRASRMSSPTRLRTSAGLTSSAW